MFFYSFFIISLIIVIDFLWFYFRVVKFKLLIQNAKLPTKGSSGAAGYDLYSTEDCIIEKGKVTSVPTGVSVELPAGCYGRIAGRSGIAKNHGVVVLGGVIDRDYRGEIIVLLSKLIDGKLEIKKGDRIAQIIFESTITYPYIMKSDFLNLTERGNEGFGSTGKN